MRRQAGGFRLRVLIALLVAACGSKPKSPPPKTWHVESSTGDEHRKHEPTRVSQDWHHHEHPHGPHPHPASPHHHHLHPHPHLAGPNGHHHPY